jgi:acyl carrier protein
MPAGAVGELCVGGDGVARGYLGDGVLTTQKFVSNPHVEGDRLYRTGDLASFQVDGNIRFHGRRDSQVKVRGFRIELSEIENRLMQHEEVKEAVVIVLTGQSGEKYICAYIVSPGGDPRLKDYLARILPGYMIPSHFVRLDKIPLTANGKVDRDALPAPQAVDPGTRYDAPRDEVEKGLVEIWAEVLEIDAGLIGMDHDFFRLGGHSLKSTVLASKIHKTFNAKIPLMEIFKTPTVRALAQYIKNGGQETFAPVEAVEKKEYYALSSAQRRLYIQWQVEGEGTGYNIPQVFQFQQGPHAGELENILQQLIQRHESLRVSFQLIDGRPVQKIHDLIEFELQHFKNRELNHSLEHFIRPFDLSQAPLMRAGLVETPDRTYFLLIDMHHIISDLVSQRILVGDFITLYADKPLAPLKLQYTDYAEWQHREAGALEKQKQYWLDLYAGKIPRLNLPLDFPRTDVRNYDGDQVRFTAAAGLGRKLKELAEESGATLYMVMMAAYNVLLHKYSRQEDIVVGSPVSGRRHSDLQEILGMFVNMLPIRNFPAAAKSFASFLGEVKVNALRSFENQEFQYEELTRELGLQGNVGRNALFDTVFEIINVEGLGGAVPGSRDEDALPGISAVDIETQAKAVFDIILTAVETGNGAVELTLKYATALFRRSRMEKMTQHYIEVLSQVAENPGIQLKDISISHKLITLKAGSARADDGDFGF